MVYKAPKDYSSNNVLICLCFSFCIAAVFCQTLIENSLNSYINVCEESRTLFLENIRMLLFSLTLMCSMFICVMSYELVIVCDCCGLSRLDKFPMIPICCTLCQAKCEQKEGGPHTCTCPDGYAGDGTICYGSLLDVSIQTSII